ncbi:YTH-domain-containing protein, partial [Suhomyces tanzawaensis NRRL Y-17324]
ITFVDFRGNVFTIPHGSRFFVIKSYSILDVNSSFTHNIWTSTELGNKKLNRAFKETLALGGKIILLFLVNASGKFCGVAEMTNEIDYQSSSDIWVEQTRWKGIFPVEWRLIKDVPNKFFYHLKVPANENKPVTNSRDTQEIPSNIGTSMLKIMSSFK